MASQQDKLQRVFQTQLTALRHAAQEDRLHTYHVLASQVQQATARLFGPESELSKTLAKVYLHPESAAVAFIRLHAPDQFAALLTREHDAPLAPELHTFQHDVNQTYANDPAAAAVVLLTRKAVREALGPRRTQDRDQWQEVLDELAEQAPARAFLIQQTEQLYAQYHLMMEQVSDQEWVLHFAADDANLTERRPENVAQSLHFPAGRMQVLLRQQLQELLYEVYPARQVAPVFSGYMAILEEGESALEALCPTKKKRAETSQLARKIAASAIAELPPEGTYARVQNHALAEAALASGILAKAQPSPVFAHLTHTATDRVVELARAEARDERMTHFTSTALAYREMLLAIRPNRPQPQPVRGFVTQDTLDKVAG